MPIGSPTIFDHKQSAVGGNLTLTNGLIPPNAESALFLISVLNGSSGGTLFAISYDNDPTTIGLCLAPAGALCWLMSQGKNASLAAIANLTIGNPGFGAPANENFSTTKKRGLINILATSAGAGRTMDYVASAVTR